MLSTTSKTAAPVILADSKSINSKPSLQKKLRALFLAICITPTGLALSTSSAAGLTFGEIETTGKLDIGGALRARYDYKFDAEDPTSELDFADAILRINYESTNWLGYLDWRVYEYDGNLGDASWPKDLWVGYKIDDKQQIHAGINTVPFGLGEFWGNYFYEGINNAAGLEDVHNLGVKYQFKDDVNEFQLAYYPSDSGSWTGESKDSKHYSINLVDSGDAVTEGTNTEEKDLVVARGAHTFNTTLGGENLSTQVGASALYSTVENNRSNKDGNRKAWSVFTNNTWNNWNLQLIAGQQKIDNADDTYKDHVTIGAFDYAFNLATDANFYNAEVSYLFPEKIGVFEGVRPYLNLSAYQKNKSGYDDSMRIIPGVAFKYKAINVQAELLLGKNDPYLTGNDGEGLASGSGTDDWTKQVFVSMAYYF